MQKEGIPRYVWERGQIQKLLPGKDSHIQALPINFPSGGTALCKSQCSNGCTDRNTRLTFFPGRMWRYSTANKRQTVKLRRVQNVNPTSTCTCQARPAASTLTQAVLSQSGFEKEQRSQYKETAAFQSLSPSLKTPSAHSLSLSLPLSPKPANSDNRSAFRSIQGTRKSAPKVGSV